MINSEKLKLGGYAALAVVVAGGAGYFWAQSVHKPQIVEISQTACGVPPATARFGVPLQTAMTSIGERPFAIGPIDVPQGGGVVQLTFNPTTDGKGREVKMVDGNLQLPVAFGRDDARPERITITCRDGTIASVRYQGSNRRSATFNVIREETTAMAPEGQIEASPTSAN